MWSVRSITGPSTASPDSVSILHTTHPIKVKDFMRSFLNSTFYPIATLPVPKSAKLKSWTSCEQNGYIFVWYHAECESGWHLPKVDEIDSGEWVYHGGNELFVNCHIQEIPENGADSAHLQAVHGQNIMAGTKLGSQNPFWSLIGHHVWRGTWKQVADEDHKHMAISELSHSIKLFNKFNLGEVHIVAKQVNIFNFWF